MLKSWSEFVPRSRFAFELSRQLRLLQHRVASQLHQTASRDSSAIAQTSMTSPLLFLTHSNLILMKEASSDLLKCEGHECVCVCAWECVPICVREVYVCVCEMEMDCESKREREGESKLQKGQILFKPLLEKSIFLFHLKTHFPFLLLVAEKLTAHSHLLTLSLSFCLSHAGACSHSCYCSLSLAFFILCTCTIILQRDVYIKHEKEMSYETIVLRACVTFGV